MKRNEQRYENLPVPPTGTSDTQVPLEAPLTVTLFGLLQRVGISRSEAYRLLAARKLRAVKSGKRTLILWASVIAYVDSLPTAEFTVPRVSGGGNPRLNGAA